ncbi:Androgen-induced protein 1 [Plakobranchus ocellatus]|uniref:Androgen-induced protein 1 n=1 Tax=Plakobranchus ocellatus TaxID=259542 RepID=A0AAV4AD94_9GAST|nr:Androgen-induced protein 1 [Plakobranchus ocellatus]
MERRKGGVGETSWEKKVGDWREKEGTRDKVGEFKEKWHVCENEAIRYCLQTLYYGLCFLKDVTTDRQRSAQLQRWRDYMHASTAFPVGMFVVFTFWALYALDRELVYPEVLDELIPSWLNHSLHTAVFPFLIIDKILIHHKYPSRLSGCVMTCSLALTYIFWTLFIAYYEGLWIYPVLEVLRSHERAIFLSVCCLFFIFFYIIGEAITNFVWRQPSHHYWISLVITIESVWSSLLVSLIISIGPASSSLLGQPGHHYWASLVITTGPAWSSVLGQLGHYH